MKASHKLIGVILCGSLLLATGCGAKADSASGSVSEAVSSSAASSEAASLISAYDLR